MVVDAVLANDEWDLFLFRLSYLSPVVDRFYVGESSITFSGKPKDMVFSRRLPELLGMGYDVRVIPLDIPLSIVSQGGRWQIETYVRNTLLESVATMHPEDTVLFSDIDEIPSRTQVQVAVGDGGSLEISSVPTQVLLRRANWLEFAPERWSGKWGNVLVGKDRVPRIRRGKYPLISGEPGAHLSYVGMAAADIRAKYKSFSHGELDRDELSSENFFAFADHFHISHLGRALELGAGLLSVIQEDHFSSIQAWAFLSHPEWFSLEPISAPAHRRLVASWILFLNVRGTAQGMLNDAFLPVYHWRWIRHAVAFLLVRLSWRTAVKLGLVTFLNKKKNSQP